MCQLETFRRAESKSVLLMAAAGIGLRLIQLDADLWEKHGWRQADMAMIASNFYQNGFDILHPQIDWAGDMPGYIGTEFPLVPFLTALLYLIFGEQLFLGRLVSIIFFAVSIPLFYLLVCRCFEYKTAAWALFFYVVSPLSIFYTRNLMPESAMLCFSVGALYFFSSWIDDNRSINYLLALLFTTLALLVKIPMALIGVPIAYLAIAKHGWSSFRQKDLWVFAFASITPSVLWYHHAFSLAANNYPFHMFGEGLWIWDGGHQALLRIRVYLKILAQTVAFLLTPIGFLMAIAGAFASRGGGERSRLFEWWAVGLFLYLIVGLKGHHGHEYYQLAIGPVAAAFAGLSAIHISRRIAQTKSAYRRIYRIGFVSALIALIFVPALGLVTIKYYSQPEMTLYQAGKTLRGKIPDDSLIAAWDGNNPIIIYASKHKGWHFRQSPELRQSIEQLEELRRNGAEYFVAPLKPSRDRDAFPLIRATERAVSRRLSNSSETNSGKEIGRFSLFDPASEFGLYLTARHPKHYDDELVAIYDLRTKKIN
jgi:hypothetical protein